MKRTLLGLVALLTVVGGGSVGLYYVQRAFLSQPAESVEPEQTPDTTIADRDTAPTPIPVASRTVEDEPASTNPFTNNPRASRRPATERYAQGDGTELSTSDYAVQPAAATDEIPQADEVDSTRRRTSRALSPRDQASDDEAAPRRAADPAALRRQPSEPRSRLAAGTAAAEVDETSDNQEPVDGPAMQSPEEPRPLRPLPRREEADRYSRPLPTATPSRYQRPASAEPADDAGSVDVRDSVGRQSLDDSNSSIGDGAEGTGRPGDPQLSGSQAPTLTIEKTAPPEIQIGKPAKFSIKVRNTGSVTAHGVEIHDTIPQGTQLIGAKPEPQRGAQGSLVWDLGSLKRGDEQTVELELMPMAEGEIGSVATVHFRAEASVRTVATKPMLTMEVNGPAKVMKGQEVTLKIKLSNPGTGAATNIVLSESVPEGLSHKAGRELELEIGTLKPGESRELELGLTAAAAGQVTNVMTAQGDASLRAETQTEIEVVAPQIQVSLAGPKRRYLERNASHNISITNPGTATAKDVQLVAVLPKELKFVEANNGGQFDAATHSVYWGLEELPPQETGTVTLTTLPLQAGDAKVLIKSKAQSGLSDEREEVVTIEGLAAINFQLSDVNDPIEAGGQTTYEVRVTNQGTKAAGNVRLAALLPPEMKAVSAEGPVRYRIDGQQVVFEPLKQLAPKADTLYSIKVQAIQPGDLRLQVQVATDEIREPITKEESTRVFGDE